MNNENIFYTTIIIYSYIKIRIHDILILRLEYMKNKKRFSVWVKHFFSFISRHGNGSESVGPAPDPPQFWRERSELTRVGVGFFPIANIGFGAGIDSPIPDPETVLEPVPLIINIYHTLNYESIRLNFMLVLK